MKYFLIIISVLLLLSCDSSTSSGDNFTLLGKVSLLDSEGNPLSEGLEDIIVMLYNTVEIDPDLLKVKADYPFIGTEINQEVFFDIRDEEPIKTINCNSEGQYSFSVPKSDYNLCYYRADYGYKLIHELEVSSNQTLAEAVLNEVINLAGSISNFTFESGKVYHITDDLVIPQNSNVVFETGAYIDVADNKKIFLMDDFNLSQIDNDGFVYFNSIYNYLGPKNMFRGIECVNNESYNFSKVLIKNATTALSFVSLNAIVNIIDCIINNNNIGISTQQVNFITLSNCNIFNNDNMGVELRYNNVSKNNILYNNNEGVRSLEANCENNNNYYLSNYIGLRLAFFNDINVHNNEFDKNNYGISMSGSDPVIEYNNFHSDILNIEMCKRYVQTHREYCYPKIKYNNFIGGNFLIDAKGIHDIASGTYALSYGIDEDLECNNNFWNNNQEKIKDGDYYDDDLSYYILINYEYYGLVSNCGIINLVE